MSGVSPTATACCSWNVGESPWLLNSRMLAHTETGAGAGCSSSVSQLLLLRLEP